MDSTTERIYEMGNRIRFIGTCLATAFVVGGAIYIVMFIGGLIENAKVG